jgi:hypothetical protein
MSKENIRKVANSARIFNTDGIPKMYERIDDVFGAMLDSGYKINSVMYRALIDVRTGFYTVFINKPNKVINNRRGTQKKIRRNFKDDEFNGYIDTYIIKQNHDKRANTIISSHTDYMDNFLNDLGANKYSAKKKLVLDRGNKNKFIYNYYIETVFDRPELDKYKNIRRRKKNITHKKINNYFSLVMGFDGLELHDLDNVSSVSSSDSY